MYGVLRVHVSCLLHTNFADTTRLLLTTLMNMPCGECSQYGASPLLQLCQTTCTCGDTTLVEVTLALIICRRQGRCAERVLDRFLTTIGLCCQIEFILFFELQAKLVREYLPKSIAGKCCSCCSLAIIRSKFLSGNRL